MIKYQILQGVRLPQATALPILVPTPEGKAMGSIPAWMMLLDPAHHTAEGIRNRAQAETIYPFLGLEPSSGSFDSGAPALVYTQGEAQRLSPEVPLDGDAWSFFAVVNITSFGTGGRRDLVWASGVSQEHGAFLGFSGGGGGIDINGVPGSDSLRLRYTPPYSISDRTILVMYTFSTRDGLRIYLDGVLGAHAPDETEPLTQSAGAGQWRMFTDNIGGRIGMTGLLGIDLGWAEHAGYRRSIERFLMDKYGISA